MCRCSVVSISDNIDDFLILVTPRPYRKIDNFANPNFCSIHSFVGAKCNVFVELMSQNLTE